MPAPRPCSLAKLGGLVRLRRRSGRLDPTLSRSCTSATTCSCRTSPVGVASDSLRCPTMPYLTLAPDWICEVAVAVDRSDRSRQEAAHLRTRRRSGTRGSSIRCGRRSKCWRSKAGGLEQIEEHHGERQRPRAPVRRRRARAASALELTTRSIAAARARSSSRMPLTAPARGPYTVRNLRIALPRVLRELEVGAVIPLLRQRGRRRQIHRVFDGDLVAHAQAILGQRQPLDGVLARARRARSGRCRRGSARSRSYRSRASRPPIGRWSARAATVERWRDALRPYGRCARRGRPCYRTAARPRLRRPRSCAARRVSTAPAWAPSCRAHPPLASLERHALPA